MTTFHVQLFQTSAGSVNWRLLSGNNRECGRGIVHHRDLESCLSTLDDLRGRLDTFSHRSRRADPHRWHWELSALDRTVVATSPTFDRLIRCEQGAQQFLGAFAVAPIRTTVVSCTTRRRGSAA